MTAVMDAPVVDDVSAIQGRTLRQLAWARLKRNKIAMISMTLAVFMIGSAFLAPVITALLHVSIAGNATLLSNDGGMPNGVNGGMSWAHPFGLQPLTGRDLLALLLYGARITFFVALTSTVLVLLIGTVVGTVAAAFGGWVDAFFGWTMDLVLTFPQLLMILALNNVITNRITSLGVPEGNPSRVVFLIVVFTGFGWPYIARIIRGQVISLREREFVEAAVAMGASRIRIVFKELLPNLWATMIVYASITLPGFIGLEATLAFLNIGVDATMPTWGSLLDDATKFFFADSWYLIFPASALVISVLSFNLLGDGLRDALDPRAGRV
jgi:peptide/nickel transport system permease protein